MAGMPHAGFLQPQASAGQGAAWPAPPRAAVLDGITSHVTKDGDAADAYTQTKVATGYVMLVRATDDAIARFWGCLGSLKSTSTYHVSPSAAASAGGPQRAVISDGGSLKLNATGGVATEHVDGGWHLIHVADHDNAPNGDIYTQADGATRELLGSYLRPASPSPDFTLFTLGAFRYKPGPLLSTFAEGTIGYLARYDGEQLSAASWDAIWEAFDTGGGRADTRVITARIQGLLTTGTLKTAGDLDGSTPNHVGSNPATFIDCTFERAVYTAHRYAYSGAAAYITASAADAATINAQLKSAAGSVTVVSIMQSDMALGDETVYREQFGAFDDADTTGSGYLVSRHTLGQHRFVALNDAGGIIRDSGTAGPVIYDGSPHMALHIDTAAASIAQAKIAADGAAFVNLGGTYNRGSVGALGWFTLSGGVRGPDPPTVNAELGHCLFRAVIHEDLTADRADLWNAFNTALGDSAQDNMHAACRALMAAIESAVASTANIIFAMEFLEGASPDYGDAPTIIGAQYSPAGVTP